MAKGKKGKGGRPKMTAEQKKHAKAELARPNLRVIARQDRFRHFHGDGSIGLEMTCAGRLMLVGAFNGLEASPEEILNALQNYRLGYWGNYHGGAQMSDYEKEVKGGNDNDEPDPDNPDLVKDLRGKWFDGFDAALRDCGDCTRRAVHSITVDLHWFPDEDADWAERVINSAILAKRELLRQLKRPIPDTLTVVGELATDSDFAMLELARQGAMALARPTVKKMAA